MNNNRVFAAEQLYGRGRVIVQAVPLRLQWSDLARSQSFVVMVRDWVEYLAQPRATQYNLRPGEPIVVKLPQSMIADPSSSSSTALLTTPIGQSLELAADHDIDSFVYRSSRTRLPGDYQLEIGLAEHPIPFHVQRDEIESDLTALSDDALKQIAAATTANRDENEDTGSESKSSDPLWPFLLLGLIAILTGELVLSGILSRERFGTAGVPEFSELDAGFSSIKQEELTPDNLSDLSASPSSLPSSSEVVR